MPTERYSRIRPNGADSGSRPSARAPSATPRSSGAPRCGRAERDDVADQVVPRAVRVRADRARGPHDQAAHRVPDQRDPAYGGRPPGHEVVEQRRQGDTVLGDRQAGVGAQVDRRPRGVGGQPLAVAAPALPGPALPRLVGLAQAVQEDHDVRGRGRERLGQRVPVERHVAPVASDRHRDRQPVLLLGEPVADQPVDGGDHGPARRASPRCGTRSRGGRRRGARVPSRGARRRRPA